MNGGATSVEGSGGAAPDRDGVRVGIIGAGAVGASVAAMMMEAGLLPCVVAAGERADRLRRAGITVNGRTYAPAVVDPDSADGELDLLILATKSTHLDEALPMLARVAGPRTTVVSLLNGITSERLIRDALAGAGHERPEERVVPAMILGIDAVRTEEGVTYRNRGTIHFGADPAEAPVPGDRLDSLEFLFGRAGVPAKRSENITRTLWYKFMINVGINQASAVLRGTYGLFQRSEHARALMVDLMREAIELSRAAGTGLTDADLDSWLETLAGLDPDGKTSMLQDVEAGRPTEIDLFAGTILGLGERFGVATPVNRTIRRIIRAEESRHTGG